MPAAVAIRHLSKSFVGTRALDDVDLDLLPGEVHGLLGQNGSGKSTLIKVLAGFHVPDPGAEISAYGEALQLPLTASDLERLGWVFVHQDLGLVNELRVVDNFHLLRLGSAGGSVIRWREDRAYVSRVLAEFDVDVSPDAVVGELSGAQRAMVAIVRAAELIRRRRDEPDQAESPGLLVLDEPTAYLPEGDAASLFDLVRRVAAGGTAVLLVSHMLDEIRAMADRVTVLRDGSVTATVVTETVDNAQLVEAIVGHQVVVTPKAVIDELEHPGDANTVTVRGLLSPRTASLDFDVTGGQVLGITGLAGSGAEDVPGLLFGAASASGGTLRIDGDVIDLRRLRPDIAMRHGIAFIPANRLAQGAAGDLDVTMNVTLTTLHRFVRGAGVLSRNRERAAAWRLVDEYDVRPRDPDRSFAQLSGGNQQKALLAKWLQDAPRLLVLHEPAQGLDVEARAQVVEIIRALASTGTAVVCASTDFEQIEQICDRVLILRRGRIRSELTGAEITQRRLSEDSLSQEDAA